MSSLNARVYQLLEQQPDATALIFVTRDGEQTITTREFFEQAARYAQALQKQGVQPGDLVVLVLEHSLDVLYSFWGAILLGAIPSIFPFLTEKLDPERYFASLRQLISQSGVRLVVTYPALHTALAELDVLLLVSNQLDTNDSAMGLQQHIPEPESIAFLQHSSGSTGLQKGVMLSHQAVLNQIESYSQAINLQQSDVIASWLPLYHDMGLIAGFILPTTQGIPLILLSPFHWVRAPHILLQAMHQHRATLCWLPNFAYNLMATRVRDVALENLDLSHVRAFINCSEPVRAESHAAFLERYRPYGLREEALTVSYAMAENVFAVTQSGPQTVDVIDKQTFLEQQKAVSGKDHPIVSCGQPIPGVELQILDDNKNQLPERHIGEIALRSHCMLTGYHARPELTAQAFHEGWYLTGDLGYLADGELYVTGRKKDLIIVGGKNLYPQDIEAIVSDIDGVKDGRTVAFGIPNDKLGTEDVIVIAEVHDEQHQQEIQREARQRVVQATDVNARYVHLVPSQWLIKTSSGKIARTANREKFLAEMRAQGFEL